MVGIHGALAAALVRHTVTTLLNVLGQILRRQVHVVLFILDRLTDVVGVDVFGTIFSRIVHVFQFDACVVDFKEK
jgi:hypothetical protein